MHDALGYLLFPPSHEKAPVAMEGGMRPCEQEIKKTWLACFPSPVLFRHTSSGEVRNFMREKKAPP